VSFVRRPASRLVSRLAAPVVAGAAVLAGCSGGFKATGPGPSPGETPDQHRVAPVACPSNSAGLSPCTSDAECVVSPPTTPPPRCLSGFCNGDECLTDDQCSTGNACRCADAVGGYGVPTNRCVPADCRVDADCGAGGFCSPTGGSCGAYTGVEGFYCHGPGDHCFNDSDCGAGGICFYALSIGQWTCGTSTICPKG
jgi:hypothetical protein